MKSYFTGTTRKGQRVAACVSFNAHGKEILKFFSYINSGHPRPRSLTTRANVSPRRPFLPFAEWCVYPFDEPAYRFITPIDYRRYSINMFMLVFAGGTCGGKKRAKSEEANRTAEDDRGRVVFPVTNGRQ